MTTTPRTRGVTLPDPQRGEVWLVRFDPSIGDEQTKTRPAIVVNVPEVGRLMLRIVVPLTDWKAWYEELIWFTSIPSTPENGLSKDSGADAFQVKSASLTRFEHKLGSLTDAQMSDIAAAIAICVGY